MGAFEHVVVLFSFVYAVALTHILSTGAAMLRADSGLRFSWIYLGWLINAVIVIIANWTSLWDLRGIQSYSIAIIFFTFGLAIVNYLYAALVSLEGRRDGELDLRDYHDQQGRRYIGAFVLSAAMALAANLLFGSAFSIGEFLRQNAAVVPMVITSIIAWVFVRRTWVQAAALVALIVIWSFYFGGLQSALS